ncbi:MAG: hypothetical protein HYU86_02285 [Chloroflexi bacterium]|nr:hypothetical protein [Chloroflexota bacterium]
MNLLPLLGLIVGLVIGRPWALIVTALAAAIGFGLVAILTDEISGWGDLYVWGDLVISLAITGTGIIIRRWVTLPTSGQQGLGSDDGSPRWLVLSANEEDMWKRQLSTASR